MNRVTIFFDKTTARDVALWGAYFEACTLPFSIAAAQWGIGLMFFVWLTNSLRTRKFSLSLGAITWPFLVYVAIFVIASAFAERAGHSVYSVWDNEWLALSAALLLWINPDERELRRIVAIVIGAGTLAAIYGIIQHFTGLQLVSHHDLFLAYDIGNFNAWRPIGFFSHALSYGYDISMLLFFVLGLSLYNQGSRNWVRISALVLMSLAVLSSFSRSTWITVIVTGLLVAAIIPRSNGRHLLLAAVVFIVALMLITPQVRKRAEMLGAADNPDRVVYWHIAWQIFLDHPVLGIGADNWDLLYPRYRPAQTDAPLDFPDHPHNEYLNVLSSAGAPGLLAFLWLWGTFMVGAYRSYHKASKPFDKGMLLGGAAAILCMLGGQLTQDIFHDFTNQLLWWFIVGLTLVVMQRIEKNPAAINS